jgi:ketosteroid isomerase-like protein
MQEQQNVDLVKKLYEAFGKGDIDAITDSLADQFVWRFDAPSVIRYAGKYNTRDQVKEGFLRVWQAFRKIMRSKRMNSSPKGTK